ncbi:MAG: hypothetical protein ACE5FO_04435 [Parvularculaceae bacterium]
MKALLALAVGLIAGIFGSDFAISTYYMLFDGESQIKCLPDGGSCVGDEVTDRLILRTGFSTLDRTGGLSSIICEDTNPGIIEEEYIFVNAILLGKRCEGDIRQFILRNTKSTFDIVIRGGQIAEIRRGPLHNIDL